jgi:hypothetical protein
MHNNITFFEMIKRTWFTRDFILFVVCNWVGILIYFTLTISAIQSSSFSYIFCYMISVFIIYALNAKIVFSCRFSFTEFIKSIICYIPIFLITFIFKLFFSDLLHWNKIIVYLIATLLVMPPIFLLMKIFAFGKGGFGGDLDPLRQFSRGILLPIQKTRQLILNALTNIEVNSVLDFGSGTLFWSDWFLNEFNCQIYAVDNYYKGKILSTQNGIKYYWRLDECFIDCQSFSVVFVCDVFHHLDPIEYETFWKEIINRSKVVIIKDMDKNHQFENFMNKMHDKIISGENIQDIDPQKIERVLVQNGYKTQYYYIPKLWYPHFIIVGIKP